MQDISASGYIGPIQFQCLRAILYLITVIETTTRMYDHLNMRSNTVILTYIDIHLYFCQVTVLTEKKSMAHSGSNW